MHGLKERVKTVEFSLESDQPSQSDANHFAIKNFVSKIMQNINFDSSAGLEILVMRISAQTACPSIFLPIQKIKVYEIHSIGIVFEFVV